MRETCRRIDDGRAIRDAMDAQGLTLPALAERTKELDPEGRGISYQLIGFLVAQGKSARKSASPHAARLIALALDRPEGSLFTRGPIGKGENSSQVRNTAKAA